jgi:hypothetical protein
MVKRNCLAEKTKPTEMLGLEVFDTGDLVIPRYKIVQPTSKEGTPGVFKNNQTNAERDKISVVVLAATKGRVCWGENIEDDPVCRSSNGLQPSEEVENPVNPVCGTKENGKRFEPVCPNAIWQDHNQRPVCDEVINLLCLSRDDQVPFFISLHGCSSNRFGLFCQRLGCGRRASTNSRPP